MKLIADWPKIINSRNPFTRLYSAWNDKSRSFPKYENGSIIYYGMDLNEKFKNKLRVHHFKFYPPLNPPLENWWRKRAIILSKTLRQEELNDLIKSFNRWYNARYVAGWKVFEEKQPIDRYVSWEAFIEYVAANPGDRAHDHHWRSQFNQCRICDLDYDLITHLEKSDDEVDFILEKLKVENLTYVGMVSTDR